MGRIFIGDEHCRGKFARIYGGIKDDSSIDFIGCAGDYFSPYSHYEWADQKANFLDIIGKAKADGRICLLLGNHDLMYLHSGDGRSRYDSDHSWEIREMFLDNIGLFHIAVEFPEQKALFSHAGISSEWLGFFERLSGHSLDDVSELDGIIHSLRGEKSDIEVCTGEDDEGRPIMKRHELWLEQPAVHAQVRNLFEFRGMPWDTCGESPSNSPVWIRPNGLCASFPDRWDIQIVGHTKCYRDTLERVFFLKGRVDGDDGTPFTVRVNEDTDRKVIMIDTDYSNTYWRWNI